MQEVLTLPSVKVWLSERSKLGHCQHPGNDTPLLKETANAQNEKPVH